MFSLYLLIETTPDCIKDKYVGEFWTRDEAKQYGKGAVKDERAVGFQILAGKRLPR